MKQFFLLTALVSLLPRLNAQEQPVKVKHAEPLYIDLIRDLGARKGEKEWNIGASVNDRNNPLAYAGFAEYEFAPLNRLGLEIEVPFSIYRSAPLNGSASGHNKIEGIKTAIQYTFLVSPSKRLSMAVGYIHELGLHSFYTASREKHMLKSHTFNPVFIVAKRWGANWHSMLYTGPVFEKEIAGNRQELITEVNTSIHYTLPGSSHFIGMEINQQYGSLHRSIVLRPQSKLKLSNTTALGLVTGIPLISQHEGISFMFRLIYEPQRKG